MVYAVQDVSLLARVAGGSETLLVEPGGAHCLN